MKKTVLTIIILLVEIALYWIFRDRIILFFSKFPPINDLESNIISSLIWVGIALLNAPLAFFLYNKFHLSQQITNRKLIKAHINAKKWLLSSKVHWSPTHCGEEIKIANCVEGLFCLVYSAEPISTIEEIILKKVVKSLLENTSDKGLKSLSMGKETVHCTAMGAFILQEINTKGLYSFKRKEIKKIKTLIQSLLKVYTNNGWGFLNESCERDRDNIRLFSTFWALRALNLNGYSNDKKFIEIMSNLITITPSHLFGFTHQEKPMICMTSLFLILVLELKNKTLKDEIINSMGIEKITDFILDGLADNIFTEIEEYSYNVDGVEKLAWVHISAGLGIHALSLVHQFLSSKQKKRLNISVNKILNSNIASEGYYYDSVINFVKNDPKIFPTAYFIAGIYFYINNIVSDMNEER